MIEENIYQITHCRGSLIVCGDIDQWLLDKKAKIRPKGGYYLGRNVIHIEKLSSTVIKSMRMILGEQWGKTNVLKN